jgi:hypothetical protein
LYNIYYICIALLTHWQIQRIGTSRIFCQNRVEIAHIASLSLKTKNNGGPSLPLWKSISVVEPHFENAWIRPFDVFELKCLVRFMGDCTCIKKIFLISHINWKTVTLICFYNAIKLPIIYWCYFCKKFALNSLSNSDVLSVYTCFSYRMAGSFYWWKRHIWYY